MPTARTTSSGRKTTSPKRKRADGYHHGDLRKALIDSALALIQKKGTKALTLRAVARMAGVSQAAPYRHFADKDTLLAAVAEEGFRMLAEEMAQAMENGPRDPLAKFQASGVAYVRFAASHPSHYQVMFGPELADRERHQPLFEAGKVTKNMLTGAIKAVQESGTLRPGNPDDLALAAWTIVHGLASLYVNGQLAAQGITAKNLPDIAARLNELFFEGLAQKKKQAGGPAA